MHGLIVYVVVAPDGTFTDPGLKIPTGVASGPHQILFSDVEGRYFEVTDFDVTGTSPTPPPSSCSAPSVSLTPSAGPVGSQFVMKGAGWISGGVVHITLPNGSKGIFGAADATPTVSAGGAWQTTVTVGKSPAGSYTFSFAETGCASQTGTFQVTASPAPPPACPSNPAVAFSPSSGHLGTTFTITGSGWVPGGKVTGTLPYGSPGVFTGYQAPTVNASRDFSYKMTVGTGPGGPTPRGAYVFTYAEKYGGCSLSFRQTFTVTPKSPPSTVINVPVYTQFQKLPSSSEDCGPTSVAMVLQKYGKFPSDDNTPSEQISAVRAVIAGDPNASDVPIGSPFPNKTGATGAAEFEYALKHYGASYTELPEPLSINDVTTAIQQGHPVIAFLKAADLTGNYGPRGYTGHWLVVKGFVVSSGVTYVVVNDPDANWWHTLTSSSDGSNQEIPLPAFETAANGYSGFTTTAALVVTG